VDCELASIGTGARSSVGQNSLRRGGPTAVIQALGELPPFTRQFFVLPLTLIGPAVRQLLTFCRVGAEFFSEISELTLKRHRE
jgi:hypothetical protein